MNDNQGFEVRKQAKQRLVSHVITSFAVIPGRRRRAREAAADAVGRASTRRANIVRQGLRRSRWLQQDEGNDDDTVMTKEEDEKGGTHERTSKVRA